MTSIIAICGSFGLLGLICIIGYIVNRKAKKDHNEKDKELIAYFKQWNNQLQTKKAAEDFYNLLASVCKNGFGLSFKLNITKQEFEQLSLESIKTLNNQALDDLLDEIRSR